jgi:hypothetical protein
MEKSENKNVASEMQEELKKLETAYADNLKELDAAKNEFNKLKDKIISLHEETLLSYNRLTIYKESLLVNAINNANNQVQSNNKVQNSNNKSAKPLYPKNKLQSTSGNVSHPDNLELIEEDA